jgi:hypothetical protein
MGNTAMGSRIPKIVSSFIVFLKRNTGTDKAADAARPRATYITTGMEVVGSCGTKVGLAKGVENVRLKLQGNPSISATWILRVDRRIHLTKTLQEVESGWNN